MSKTKRAKTEIRKLASQAKARLIQSADKSGPPVPRNLSPRQREIYIKLYDMRSAGKSVDNPIECFADKKMMLTLSPAERQRYIIQLAADYNCMKKEVERSLLG